jgi:hypothetical protein
VRRFEKCAPKGLEQGAAIVLGAALAVLSPDLVHMGRCMCEKDVGSLINVEVMVEHSVLV